MRLDAPWLRDPAVTAVISALDGNAFFVGGAVRNTLLGANVDDIDLATPLLPQTVAKAVEAAGLRAVPTGIDHGTVTVVAEGTGIEVTTFRADVTTDGRRATVRFSTEIAEDARRRDFTMNAVYADSDGQIVDPLDGLPDLLARRVRFIGSAQARIREDYLRILRFFRFHAWYGGEASLDQDGLDACADLAPGMGQLARERIGGEMKKLMAASDPVAALVAMLESGVLAHCLSTWDVGLRGPLRSLLALEADFGCQPDWQVRLAVIDAKAAASDLRLSNADGKALAVLMDRDSRAAPPVIAAYLHGPARARALTLVQAARAGAALPDDLDSQITAGTQARFPLAAQDLIDQGLAPGPALGAALKRAEDAWVASGFLLDKAALLGMVLHKGQ